MDATAIPRLSDRELAAQREGRGHQLAVRLAHEQQDLEIFSGHVVGEVRSMRFFAAATESARSVAL